MFKNAKVFQLEGGFSFDQTQLHERLGERVFRPCGPLETSTLGWASPLGSNAENLAHLVGGCLLIAARRQERLLPASVVTEAVAERVAEIEQNEARDVGRRERSQLREDMLTEMLPRAFTRSRLLRAYIDPAAGWLVVDASSDKVAEDLVSLLRETLGSLPAKPLRATTAVDERMTTWVATDTPPSGFEIEDQCEMRDPGDSRGVVRCRGQDLTSPEIKAHLDTGKRVVALSLTWQERLSLVLGEDLSIKRLRFSDELIDEAVTDDDDEQARFDAGFIIMSGELRTLLAALRAEFAPVESP